MTYAEAIQFLQRLAQFGSQFGLENPRRLAVFVGNPQDKLRFIHVAGTNGKGSTCAMLEGIYRAAGLRVGLYTSPHLVRFSERIQINRQPIADADVARLVAVVGQASCPSGGANNNQLGALDAKRLPAGRQDACPTTPPDTTFFEFVTVMALRYFAEQQCDLVIWETGLGGRLDATNIVTPLASVITNIQFDHERWLGDTLAKIASEKAGIIKPGVPVITAVDGNESLAVIQETARQNNSPLTVVTMADAGRAPLDKIKLPLLGEHQRLNAALAIATVNALHNQLPVGATAIHSGLSQVRWLGRMQLVDLAGGRKVLLDGAHNPAGATALAAAVAEHFSGAKPALILGALADKDCRAICEILAPVARRILCVPVNSERTMASEKLADICQRTSPAAEVCACAVLADALGAVANEPFVVIAGSLYLIGEALEQLHLATTPGGDEKGLNEWSSTATTRG